jgi:aquaporin Z
MQAPRSVSRSDRSAPQHAAVEREPDRKREEADEATEPNQTPWARRLAAETLGTFALVFAAAGADVTAAVSGGEVSTAARAVAPALMVAALIYAIGDVSGAHFNPAISLAFWARRLFPAAWLPFYWSAQLIGATAAALVLRGLFGSAIEEGVSTPHVEPAAAVAIEAILTALLAVIALGTADRSRIVGPNAAIAVGATIAMAGLVALPIEGASMNPARSIGPAVVAGDVGNVWIYVVGPVIGALVAVALLQLVHGPPHADQGPREAAQGES